MQQMQPKVHVIFEQIFTEQTFHIVFIFFHDHCYDNLVCLAVVAE